MQNLPDSAGAVDHEIVIIGAGLSGIGVAAALRRAGIDEFVLLERAQDFGGTWRDNNYPGVGVDVPTWGYQFSYELNPEWSRAFAKGHEVKSYIDGFVTKYQLRRHVRFGVEVGARHWDEDNHLWRIQVDGGREITARYVVSAVGAYVQKRPVSIPDFDRYTGKVLEPTAWDYDYDLTGKRVAVIGTGATAVQIIPSIAADVEHLDVYQRTAIWVLPKLDPEIPEALKRVFRRSRMSRLLFHKASLWAAELSLLTAINRYRQFRLLQKAIESFSKLVIAVAVRDRELRRKLTPRYPFGSKRAGMTNNYLQTFRRDDVELVTEPIERFTETGIRTTDGVERPIDAVVVSLGYRMAFDPEAYRDAPVHGRDGFELGDHFARHRLKAYQGITMPGLPNYFMLFSAYSTVGGTWQPFVENSGRHIVRVVQEARRRAATRVEVSEAATDREHAEIMKRMRNSLFTNRDCRAANTYYLDQHGDAPILRPRTVPQSRRDTESFPLDAYDYAALTAASAEPTRLRRGGVGAA